MGSDLLRKGIELFAAGDVAGAAHAWLEAKAAGETAPQLDAYLQHIGAVEPRIYASVVHELGGPSPESEQTLAAVPHEIASPLPIPLALTPTPQPRREPESAYASENPPRSWVALAEVLPLPSRAHASESRAPAPAPQAGGFSPALRAAVDEEARAFLDEVEPPSRARRGVAQGDVDPWSRPGDIDVSNLTASVGPGLKMIESQTAAVKRSSAGRPVTELVPLRARLRELLEVHDFTGALACAQAILEIVPGDPDTLLAQRECTEKLLAIYRAKVGDVAGVPAVLLGADEVIWLDLDHRSGFVLAQIDGVSSYEEIVELAGMDELECYRILAKLVRDRVIGVP